jgi:signal transduction histidine kinase
LANNDTLSLFVGFINFTNTFSSQEIYDSADVYLQKANKWRKYVSINFYDDVLRLQNALNNARLKNYPIAIAQMDSSIKNAKAKGDLFLVANISSHLTRTLIENNQIQRAKKVGEEAMAIAQRENIYSSQKYLNKHLSKIAETEGNYKKSLEYYKNFKLLEDSFTNVQQEGNINRLKFLREKQEKEAIENQASNSLKEALLNEKEARHQKQLSNYMLAGILALLIVLLLVVYLWIQNRKTLKKLKESQELINANSIELESYNERLIEINSIKNKLLSLLAHDLRSPLVGIVSSMNLIKEDEFTKEETDEILQEIYNSALSNLQGLDNLVAWAKSQMEGLNITNQSFNLNIVLGELENELQNLVITKKINLVLEKDANVKIKADKEMIKSALRNLLTNALKFSNQKQTVSLSIEDGGSIVEIKIKDEAGGIPKNLQNQIFKEPLKSANGTRGERGSGIGLLSVKEFVNLNGGEIKFESTENVGTTFTLTLNKAF